MYKTVRDPHFLASRQVKNFHSEKYPLCLIVKIRFKYEIEIIKVFTDLLRTNKTMFFKKYHYNLMIITF